MTTTECAGAVLRALATQAGLHPDQIALTDTLWAIPGMESVKVLRAVAEIETTCRVTVPDDFLFETATVADLIELVTSLAGMSP
jgi:acyl carrier protein